MKAIDLLCYTVALVLFTLAAWPAVPRRDSLIAAGLAFFTFPEFWSAVSH